MAGWSRSLRAKRNANLKITKGPPDRAGLLHLWRRQITGVETGGTNCHWCAARAVRYAWATLLENAMPALKPTEFTARITWLGVVSDQGDTLRSEPLEAVEATLDGFPGEAHGGATRPACTRVRTQYARGTPIRNVRQLSILSAEELAAIAAEMGLERIDPAWVGASMVVEGIPDFTHVPPSSRLMAPSGAGITIDMENRPCIYPGKEIEQEAAGFGKRFKPAAQGRRGVTAWIEFGGRLAVGDALVLHVPDQPVWAHLAAARA